MEALYSIKHKGKIAFLLLLLIVIELVSNGSQRDNFARLEEAFTEVYADRLVVQDYIYNMTEKIHHQKYRIMTDDKTSRNLLLKEQNEIETLIKQYEHTFLTETEKTVLLGFIKNVREFEALNENYMKLEGNHLMEKNVCLKKADMVLADLNKLNNIQLTRGENIKGESAKIVSFANTISQLNWAIIIIIGLFIQLIVFTANSVQPKVKQNEFLN